MRHSQHTVPPVGVPEDVDGLHVGDSARQVPRSLEITEHDLQALVVTIIGNATQREPMFLDQQAEIRVVNF